MTPSRPKRQERKNRSAIKQIDHHISHYQSQASRNSTQTSEGKTRSRPSTKTLMSPQQPIAFTRREFLALLKSPGKSRNKPTSKSKNRRRQSIPGAHPSRIRFFHKQTATDDRRVPGKDNTSGQQSSTARIIHITIYADSHSKQCQRLDHMTYQVNRSAAEMNFRS